MNRAQRRAAEKKERAGKFAALMPQNPLEYQMKLAVAEKWGSRQGFSNGVDDGVRLAMGIMLLALLDKGHINRDDIIDSWADVIDLSDSIKKKYLSAQDVFDTLLNEYDVEI